MGTPKQLEDLAWHAWCKVVEEDAEPRRDRVRYSCTDRPLPNDDIGRLYRGLEWQHDCIRQREVLERCLQHASSRMVAGDLLADDSWLLANPDTVDVLVKMALEEKASQDKRIGDYTDAEAEVIKRATGLLAVDLLTVNRTGVLFTIPYNTAIRVFPGSVTLYVNRELNMIRGADDDGRLHVTDDFRITVSNIRVMTF